MGGHINEHKISHPVELDAYQQVVWQALQELQKELMAAEGSSFSKRIMQALGQRKPAIQGLYIYGAVGRGKTMLMDRFFEGLTIEKKQRYHFHAFMQKKVHQRLKQLGSGNEQPIETLAKEIAGQARVLCFDEFHVCDIADAMILGRLFSRLFKLGTVVIATSNQKPDDLYEGGLHRDRFLPFIKLLKESCKSIELSGGVDYRRLLLSQHKRYFSPLGEESEKAMSHIFDLFADGTEAEAETMTVNGRHVNLPAVANGVVRVSFKDLCEIPLGPSDYLALVDHFHTIFMENVPIMDESMHNEAKRFITLIDILYDRGRNLVMSAQAEPDRLYISGKNSDFFVRTSSRLMEMTH